MPGCPVALRLARGDPIAIVENKTASASSMTLKDRIDMTGVELRWYPRTEYAELSDEQKDEFKKFKSLTARKKQIAANAKKQTQSGGGNPSASKKGKGDGNSSSTLSNKQIVKIAAAVAKVGKKNGKEDAKFDKGMAKLLLILVGTNSPAQVGGIVASPPVAVDGEKMAQISVVI